MSKYDVLSDLVSLGNLETILTDNKNGEPPQSRNVSTRQPKRPTQQRPALPHKHEPMQKNSPLSLRAQLI